MNKDEIRYLAFEEAAKLVGAIQEEEDIQQSNKRILTVYSKANKELCWFDYDDVIQDIGDVAKADQKEAVQSYILAHIPDWALDI